MSAGTFGPGVADQPAPYPSAIKVVDLAAGTRTRLTPFVDRACGGAAQRRATSRIRSSPGAGAPRPSRFEVVTHRLPFGATTTVRSRP